MRQLFATFGLSFIIIFSTARIGEAAYTGTVDPRDVLVDQAIGAAGVGYNVLPPTGEAGIPGGGVAAIGGGPQVPLDPTIDTTSTQATYASGASSTPPDNGPAHAAFHETLLATLTALLNEQATARTALALALAAAHTVFHNNYDVLAAAFSENQSTALAGFHTDQRAAHAAFHDGQAGGLAAFQADQTNDHTGFHEEQGEALEDFTDDQAAVQVAFQTNQAVDHTNFHGVQTAALNTFTAGQTASHTTLHNDQAAALAAFQVDQTTDHTNFHVLSEEQLSAMQDRAEKKNKGLSSDQHTLFHNVLTTSNAANSALHTKVDADAQDLSNGEKQTLQTYLNTYQTQLYAQDPLAGQLDTLQGHAEKKNVPLPAPEHTLFHTVLAANGASSSALHTKVDADDHDLNSPEIGTLRSYLDTYYHGRQTADLTAFTNTQTASHTTLHNDQATALAALQATQAADHTAFHAQQTAALQNVITGQSGDLAAFQAQQDAEHAALHAQQEATLNTFTEGQTADHDVFHDAQDADHVAFHAAQANEAGVFNAEQAATHDALHVDQVNDAGVLQGTQQGALNDVLATQAAQETAFHEANAGLPDLAPPQPSENPVPQAATPPVEPLTPVTPPADPAP